MRRWTVVAMLVSVALVGAGCSSDSDDAGKAAAQEGESASADSSSGKDEVNLVSFGGGGTAEEAAGGKQKVTLTGVAATMLEFTDRPAHKSTHLATTTVFDDPGAICHGKLDPAEVDPTGPECGLWNLMFGDDPPTAAMVLEDAAAVKDLTVDECPEEAPDCTKNAGAVEDVDEIGFVMTEPTFDPESGTLVFTAELIGDSATIPSSFGAASLFIDPTDAQWGILGGVCGAAVVSLIASVIIFTAGVGAAIVAAVIGLGATLTGGCVSEIEKIWG